MHKNIVYSIIDILKRRDSNRYLTKFVDKYIVHKNPDGSNGFWSLTIIINTERLHIIDHIETLGLEIGKLNGEYLWVEKYYNAIKFS